MTDIKTFPCRMDKRTLQALEALKKRTGERTANKAIGIAVRSYLHHQESIRKLADHNNCLEQRCRELHKALCSLKDARQQAEFLSNENPVPVQVNPPIRQRPRSTEPQEQDGNTYPSDH